MYDLCSDLHIDHNGIPDWGKQKHNDILIIAGDTSNSALQSLHAITEASYHYEYVLFVDGNHEFYNSDMNIKDTMELLHKGTLGSYGSIIYLNGLNDFTIDGVAYIGVNGWYDFRAYPDTYTISKVKSLWNRMSNDSRLNFKPYDYPEVLAEHQANMLAIKVKSLNENKNVHTIVVTTHTVPNSKFLIRKGIESWDGLSGAFCNSMMDRVIESDTNKKIKYWNYGHTHTRNIIKYDHVTYINNCKGYPNEYGTFSFLGVD